MQKRQEKRDGLEAYISQNSQSPSGEQPRSEAAANKVMPPKLLSDKQGIIELFVDILKGSCQRFSKFQHMSFDAFHTMQDFIMKPDTPEPKTWRAFL